MAKRSPASPDTIQHPSPDTARLVIVTGLSGAGKQTVLKSLEDLGYYSVDNLPIELLPKFAELIQGSPTARSAALGIDIREGEQLSRFPALFQHLQRQLPTTLVFLEAEDATLARRYSETRRPHPLGGEQTVSVNIAQERHRLAEIRKLAEHIIDTSKFNVHELRDVIEEKFREGGEESKLRIYVNSFGFRNGVPTDSDLVFDVRFLPNPNYIPEFKKRTGRDPQVARYIRSFPQTQEFIERITSLLLYLLPHYIKEGKSYLTISFGCTGGQHRSVMMASEVRKKLAKAGYKAKETHRDMVRA